METCTADRRELMHAGSRQEANDLNTLLILGGAELAALVPAVAGPAAPLPQGERARVRLGGAAGEGVGGTPSASATTSPSPSATRSSSPTHFAGSTLSSRPTHSSSATVDDNGGDDRSGRSGGGHGSDD
jgi:hypothetical protein